VSVSSASLGHCLPAGVGNLSAPSAAWPRRSDPSPAHQPLVTQAETLSVGPVARAGEAGPMWPTGGRGPFPILAPLEGRAVPLAQIAARHAGEQTGPYLPGGGQWAHHPSSGIATPASAWLWRVPGALCPGLAATWSRTARRRRVPPLGQRSGDQAPAHRAPVVPAPSAVPRYGYLIAHLTSPSQKRDLSMSVTPARCLVLIRGMNTTSAGLPGFYYNMVRDTCQ